MFSEKIIAERMFKAHKLLMSRPRDRRKWKRSQRLAREAGKMRAANLNQALDDLGRKAAKAGQAFRSFTAAAGLALRGTSANGRLPIVVRWTDGE